MRTRRREMLLGAAAAVAGCASLPAPAIAQGIKELKMVTSWPANSLGLQTSAERLAQSITALSDGRLKITVYPADSFVRPFEVFDAVWRRGRGHVSQCRGLFRQVAGAEFF